jgi:hypothetical protein
MKGETHRAVCDVDGCTRHAPERAPGVHWCDHHWQVLCDAYASQRLGLPLRHPTQIDVLVVDDEPNVAATTAELLERAGYTVAGRLHGP